jgi:hypothetical protein
MGIYEPCFSSVETEIQRFGHAYMALPGDKGRPVRKADILTAIFEPNI